MPSVGSGYAPHTSIAFDLRGFSVRTAANRQQLRQAQALRHEVFCVEWQGKPHPSGLDIDPLDDQADHILVFEGDVLIGTFRLLPILNPKAVYSRHEFNLDGFLHAPGEKLEMGRACIRAHYRNNLTVLALYRGIIAYLEITQPRWLFGCSSVLTTDARQAALITRWIECQGYDLDWANVIAQPQHRLEGFTDWYLRQPAPGEAQSKRVDDLLPPLLRTYLRAGAKLAREPALDPDFACIDYFTVLDLQDSNDSFINRLSA